MIAEIVTLMFYGWICWLCFTHANAYRMTYKTCHHTHTLISAFSKDNISQYFADTAWNDYVATLNKLQSRSIIVGLPLIILCGLVWGYIILNKLMDPSIQFMAGTYASAVCILVISIVHMAFCIRLVKTKIEPFIIQLVIASEIIKTGNVLKQLEQKQDTSTS